MQFSCWRIYIILQSADIVRHQSLHDVKGNTDHNQRLDLLMYSHGFYKAMMSEEIKDQYLSHYNILMLTQVRYEKFLQQNYQQLCPALKVCKGITNLFHFTEWQIND